MHLRRLQTKIETSKDPLWEAFREIDQTLQVLQRAAIAGTAPSRDAFLIADRAKLSLATLARAAGLNPLDL